MSSDEPVRTGVQLRPIGSHDHDAVLRLNEGDVEHLSPLHVARLTWMLDRPAVSVMAEVDGAVAGFALAFREGTTYDSVNYRWFGERYEQFLYLDRIVTGANVRRRGVASRIYEHMETMASTTGVMLCEVNIDPPNDVSLAFHENRGYVAVGEQDTPSGVRVVMLAKALTVRATQSA